MLSSVWWPLAPMSTSPMIQICPMQPGRWSRRCCRQHGPVADRVKSTFALRWTQSFNLLRTGCQWRLLSREFPGWSTVYHYFQAWKNAGVWTCIQRSMYQQARRQAGRAACPSGADRWITKPVPMQVSGIRCSKASLPSCRSMRMSPLSRMLSSRWSIFPSASVLSGCISTWRRTARKSSMRFQM